LSARNFSIGDKGVIKVKRLNKFIVGAVVGVVIGLWFGVNIGKGKPFWSNPFEEKSMMEMASEKTKEIAGKAKDKTNEMVKEGKEVLREKLKEDP
jgi:hypothetical protein